MTAPLNMINKTFTYRVIIEPDGRYYHGYVPALPGCHTFGKTIIETQKNLREAISVYLDCLIADEQVIFENSSIGKF